VIRSFVINSVSHLTEELRDRKHKYEKEMNPSAVIISRKDECLDTSKMYFPIVIASMYVRRFLNENVKHILLELLNDIMEEMYKLVSSNKWMDDETRYSLIYITK